MRRFTFWHRHSANHHSTRASKRVGPTARFRTLAFQALEPRDLKTVDTTMLVAPPIVTSGGPSEAAILQVSSTVTSGAIASTADQAAAASSPTVVQPPIESTAVQTGGDHTPAPDGSALSAAVAAPNSPAPAINSEGAQTGSPTQLTSPTTDSGLQANGAAAPGDTTPSPVETVPQSAVLASDGSTPTNSTAATGTQNGGLAVQANSQSPSAITPASNADPSISQGATVANPIASSAVAPSAASSPSPSNGYGGAAYVQADNTTTGGAATSSADGYGGTPDGYGGGTSGYGGVPFIDSTTVTDAPSDTIISGTVSGEPNLAGSTVVFGGALDGYTTTVDGNNQFQIGIPTVPPIHGTVTVVVIDSNGNPSNTVTIYMG